MPTAPSRRPSPVRTSFPKDKIRVLLLERIHPRARELFAAEGFQVEQHAGALEGDELAAAARDVHVLGLRSASNLSAATLAQCPRLLTVGCFCIGTNQVDLGAANLAGVPVFNSPFSNTRSVAELTIAEIVALHRRLADKSAQMHAGVWDKSAAGAHEVRGRAARLVGYGRIGSQVSVLAEAMGMGDLLRHCRGAAAGQCAPGSDARRTAGAVRRGVFARSATRDTAPSAQCRSRP